MKTNITRSIGYWIYEHTAVQYDAIDTIQRLGYSEREATFLYTVAVYSGYFLRRQFNFFVQRERGAIATAISCARQNALGTFGKFNVSRAGLLYQLHARSLYRIVGQEDSQNRRAKSTREIRRQAHHARLRLASSREGRISRFGGSPGGRFSPSWRKNGRIAAARNFGELLPVSVRRTDGDLTVRFTFIDEGHRSTGQV